MANKKYVDVSFHLPIDNIFTYSVPEELWDSVSVGKRVRAPFRSARKKFSLPKRIKPSEMEGQLLVELEAPEQELLKKHYRLSDSGKTYIFEEPENPKELKTLEAVFKSFRGRKTGVILKVHRDIPSFRTLKIARVLDPVSILPDYAREIATWMSRYYGCSFNEALHLFVPTALKPMPLDLNIENAPPFYPLNTEQEAAYLGIKKFLNSFFPCLIYGVTGSGKTEVYRHLVKDVVSAGKQVVILVPEISLTPQTIERFTSLFGADKISIINSSITASNKLENCYRIADGSASIILGPRSALFTPLLKPGLIIIDEEQEHSYKSSESPRFHTRQVAFKMAQKLNIPLVLGSATPSVETYQAGVSNKIMVFELLKRHANVKMPSITLVDARQEKGVFSKTLIQKLLRVKEAGYQSILFLNRRGFSPYVICNACGDKFECPNCSVTLTYHKKDNTFSCHYCGYAIYRPKTCNNCGSDELELVGSGTERLEEEIQELLRGFKVLRMDRDTTGKKGSHERILSAFKQGKADILIGTQMIAKGLDFDRVRLVGVVQADITLNMPDFRSGENTFSLLTQVSGRAGRKLPGEVVIQTMAPEHYIMQMVKNQDFKGFFAKEIKLRKEFSYPPFLRMVRLVIRGEVQERVDKISSELAAKLNKAKLPVLGPVPCPMEKVNKNYRFHILIKTGKVMAVVALIKKILPDFQKNKDIYIELDVDPVSLL